VALAPFWWRASIHDDLDVDRRDLDRRSAEIPPGR
jgi:hypothetical protein